MSPRRAYEILVSAGNYCMVFMDGWEAHDEIASARKELVDNLDQLPLSDEDWESFSASNLLRWQLIRRLSGYGELKQVEQIESECAA